MQKLRAPLVGTQGYQRFLFLSLYELVVGQSIASDAVPAYRAPRPTRLIQLRVFFSNFLQSSTVECVLINESEYLFVGGIHIYISAADIDGFNEK